MAGVGSEEFLSTEIYERDGWRCGLCRRKIRRDLDYPHPLSASLDHVIPLVHGGPHLRSNAQAAHLRCNVIKRDKIENVQMMLFG
jgi:5-methylcytosine-specific restriction endonuclease McrA